MKSRLFFLLVLVLAVSACGAKPGAEDRGEEVQEEPGFVLDAKRRDHKTGHPVRQPDRLSRNDV